MPRARVRHRGRRASRHHILPRSRGGGSHYPNIALISRGDHQIYHALFQNMTPDEIIKHLVGRFWNGQWSWVQQALKKEGGIGDE